MKKRFFSSLYILCLFLSFLGMGTPLEAREEFVVGPRWTGSDLVNNTVLSGFIVDNQWTTMTTTNPWPFVNASSKLEVSLGADWDNCLGDDFEVTLKLEINTLTRAAGSSSNTSNTVIRDLAISYNKLRGTSFQAESFCVLENVSWAAIKVINITFTQGSSSSPAPDFIILDSRLIVERFYNLDLNDPTSMTAITIAAPAGQNINTDGQGEVSFSWSTVEWADEYELEWTVVGNADRLNLATGQYDPITTSNTTYDFNQDAIRIRTTQTTYDIPYVFSQDGWLVCRVRGITHQMDPNDPNAAPQRVEGPWDLQAVDFLSNAGSDNMIILPTIHRKKMNWSYSHSFAEDGKHKGVITYADASMRGRQVVSRINENRQSVATETIYDHKGRPAIQLLPVPLTDDYFGYFSDLTLTPTGQTYDWEVFDKDVASSSSDEPCVTVATPAMGTQAGSARYYSPDNPDREGAQAYVPDAKGYPFSQTVYTADNTGRIRTSAGPGETHRLGEKNSKYYYGKPLQEELDATFGASETGNAEHYIKTMVVDPNGQVSVSITNSAGETVATALAGESPSNVDALDNIGTGQMLNVDLKNENRRVNKDETACLESSFVHLVDYPKDHIITYELTPAVYTHDDGTGCTFCEDCVYDVQISVIDNDCGAEMVPGGMPFTQSFGTLGNAGDPCPVPSAESFTINVPLPPGSYTITKSLCVNKAAREEATERYLDPTINTCIKTESQMIQDALATFVPEGCDIDYCGMKCLEDLNPDDFATIADFTAAWNACRTDCTPDNECDAMLTFMKADVTPGGQYAVDQNDPYSLLNTSNTNKLGVDYTQIPIVTTDASGSTAYYKVTIGTGSNAVEKEPKDLSYQEYLDNWEDFWADFLVLHHPEYCVYEHCGRHANYQDFINELSTIESLEELYSQGFGWADQNGLPNFNPNNSNWINSSSYTNPLYNPMAGAGFGDPFFGQAWGRINPFGGANFMEVQLIDKKDDISFEEAVIAISSGCDITNLTRDQFRNECLAASGQPLFDPADNCNNNQDWIIFRTLYISEFTKEMLKERETATAACSDKNDELTQAGKSLYNLSPSDVLDIDLSDDPATIMTNIQNQATAQGDPCEAGCDAMADDWLARLDGCNILNTTLRDNLKTALKKVCKAGCDPDHPMGASTLPVGVTTDEGDNSFAEAIHRILSPSMPQITLASLTDLNDPNFNLACNIYLIETPPPYGHSLSQATATFPMLDNCACDKILWNELTFSQSPGTFTTAKEMFTEEYGIELADYNGLTCKCNEAYAAEESDPVANPFTATSSLGQLAGRYLENLQIPINAEIACQSCISCFAVQNYFDQYETLVSTPSGYDYDLLAGIINHKEGFNLTSADYVSFMESCLELWNQSGCDPQNQINDLGIWIDQMHDNQDLTRPDFSFDYTRAGSKYLHFYTSSLYDAKSCGPTDINVTTDLLYTRRFDQEVNYLVGDSKGGFIACGHTSAGQPVVFNQDVHGAIAWSTPINFGGQNLQLDNMRVAQGDNGEIWLFGLTQGSSPQLAVAKLDATGQHSWSRVLSFSQKGYRLTGVAEQPGSDDFVVSFTYQHASPDDWKLGTVLVQVKNDGTLGWYKDYDKLGGNVYADPDESIYFDQLASLTNDGFYFLTMEEDDGHLKLFNCNSAGTINLNTSIDFPEISVFCDKNGYSITEMDNGDCAILLRDKVNNRWANRIMRVTPTGTLAWEKEYTFTYSGQPIGIESHSLQPADGGGILLTGNLENPSGLDYGAFIWLNASGELVIAKERYNSYRVLGQQIGTDQHVILGGQDMIYNDIKGRANCAEGPISVTNQPFSILNQPPTVLPASQSSSPSLGTVTYSPQTTTLSFQPYCEERLFLNYQNTCGFDCDLELWLPISQKDISFALISNITNGLPTSTRTFVFDVDFNGQTIQMDGKWGCMQKCPDQELCNEPVFLEIPYPEDDCEATLRANLTLEVQRLHNIYLEEEREKYIQAYNDNCLDNVVEAYDMEYEFWQYQYTLYYYDQAGNLVSTAPPKGVDIDVLDSDPDHELRTFYNYNSLGQLIEQNTPDGGYKQFWYDELGRIVLSQDDNQEPHKYSYIKYDELGRASEAGEMYYPVAFTHSNHYVTREDLDDWHDMASQQTPPTGQLIYYYQTTTAYDDADPVISALFPNGQQHLRGRVASIVYTDGYEAWRDYSSHFSYDIHGNVDHLIQEIPALEGIGHQYKHISYAYDLISGNVHQVHYQPGEADQLIHKYIYDDDNRLIKVFTSRDGINESQEANYEYYQHGPLARQELGALQVAGNDYAYTIQGWLKGVNSTFMEAEYDMGRDGYTPSISNDPNAYFTNNSQGVGVHQNTAKDAFAYSLEYFDGDYRGIGLEGTSTKNNFLGATPHATGFRNLYNGNIGQMITSITDGQGNAQIQGTRYHYDQLQRIKKMDAFDGSASTGPSTPNPTWTWTAKSDYATEYSYDENGNLRTLNRNGNPQAGNPLIMDRLEYRYITENGVETNRLRQVEDDLGTHDANYSQAANGTEDVDHQTNTNNYVYDNIGNLISDDAEDIANIEWGVDGKIRHITRESGSGKKDLSFAYNPAGNRFVKIVKEEGEQQVDWKYTYYVHDASGNVMAVYKLDYESKTDFQNNNPDWGSITGSQTHVERLVLAEQYLYGSSRLGQIEVNELLAARAFSPIYSGDEISTFNNPLAYTAPTPSAISGTPLFLGNKRYELSNHLGNVLAVISDRKIVDCSGNDPVFLADVRMSSDYYPFGMTMGGRSWSQNEDYRFGFQNQEQDDEYYGGAVSYKYRVHDPRIGRFLSIDPLAPEYPWNSPYAFSENVVIDSRELEGLEKINATSATPTDLSSTKNLEPTSNFGETWQEGELVFTQTDENYLPTFSVSPSGEATQTPANVTKYYYHGGTYDFDGTTIYEPGVYSFSEYKKIASYMGAIAKAADYGAHQHAYILSSSVSDDFTAFDSYFNYSFRSEGILEGDFIDPGPQGLVVIPIYDFVTAAGVFRAGLFKLGRAATVFSKNSRSLSKASTFSSATRNTILNASKGDLNDFRKGIKLAINHTDDLNTLKRLHSLDMRVSKLRLDYLRGTLEYSKDFHPVLKKYTDEFVEILFK